MQTYDLEIFEQTSGHCELRLSTDGGRPRTRGLDKAAVDDLIEVVEDAYSRHATAQKVFGSAQLRELGGKLSAFLDGDERWLTRVLDHPDGTTLRIAAAQRLRHLPWELLTREGVHVTVSGHAPLLPVRAIGSDAALKGPVAVGNRPLRVLFMATSPEGVEPVLGYEAEEAAILSATSRTGTELVVEESGTLEGLRFLTGDYGDGYFDVLHLSGHATISADGQPTFLAEDEYGGLAHVTADQLARAMAGQWPRLVFVSGCLTGHAPDGGSFPSMSESLVKAGARAVLGWALPVGDISATEFAASLYEALADGRPLDRAVVQARQHLYDGKSSNWHLLRVYADKSPLAPMVTPLKTRGRAHVQARAADQEFLDPQTQLSRVASRASFVGRRRVIQRCLGILNPGHGTGRPAQALVLHGMGGLGKSSLASRLLERMPTYQRVVWYGRVDLIKFRELTDKSIFPTMEQQIEAAKLLDNDQAPLAVRLRFLLTGPLAETPCLFVFDDFEDGNLDERSGGGHVLSADMADILPALLTAIRDTGSPSRVIITSRYRFPAPAGTAIAVESLETLTEVEQTKKITNLPNLRAGSPVDPDIRKRAIQAAAGNPRLLDWLDLIVNDTTLDVDGLITAIENEADRFRRETILAKKLLSSQDPELQKMLAKVNVVELPVPSEAVYAIHDHPDAARHVARATQLGLLEEGTDPETRQPRYYVSNVLRPLIRPLITDDEHTEACAAAARSLYKLWVTDDH